MEFTLVQALQVSPEEMHKMSLADLAKLHSVLAESKQKKARLQADIVAGVINAKKKEKKAAAEPEQQQMELAAAGAENSVKAPAKPKAKAPTPAKAKAAGKTVPGVRKPAPAKPKAPTPEEIDASEEKAASAAPKAPEKKPEPKKVVSLKKKKEAAPDIKKMSKEELEKLAVSLLENSSRFPASIPGERADFNRAEFDTIEDIQKRLMDAPMSLYLLADERLDDKLTQFLVLFANAEVIVLFDRNRQKNTTVTIKAEQLTAEHITFDKQKFEYSFYIREPKKSSK